MKARRNKVPGVGAYETVARITEKGPTLGIISNLSRITHIDEVINRGLSMPDKKIDISYNLVQKKAPAFKLPKQSGGLMGMPMEAEEGSDGAKAKKGAMGKTFYEIEEAFKNSQTAERNTTINKNERKTYISHVQKRARALNNNFRFYDIEKGEKIVTKGAARGWK